MPPSGMNGKKLALILPWVVGLAFCVVEGFKILFLLDSSNTPDPKTGHTEAALFAPAISTDWSYITRPQIMVLIVVTSAALLLALLMFAVNIRNRFVAGRQTNIEVNDAAGQPAPSPRRSPKPTSFGRRD